MDCRRGVGNRIRSHITSPLIMCYVVYYCIAKGTRIIVYLLHNYRLDEPTLYSLYLLWGRGGSFQLQRPQNRTYRNKIWDISGGTVRTNARTRAQQ